ncbi:MAG: hypothetical protein ACI9U2_002115 [Bradymonadia bacterium]|jgi:hypothetical protein
MQDWQSVASGTRLWRLTIIIQAIATLVIGIAQAFWTFRILSQNVHLLEDPVDPVALAALIDGTMVFVVVLSGLGFVASGVLIVVGRRWRGGPDVPGASGKAQAYELMAVTSLALQAVVLLVTFSDGDPGRLANAALFVSVAMLFTAFSVHAGFLQSLGSGVAQLASNLSRGLVFLFLAVVFAVVLGQAKSMLAGVLSLGALVGGIVWFVYFILFMNRAIAAYEQGGGLSADVFD